MVVNMELDCFERVVVSVIILRSYCLGCSLIERIFVDNSKAFE